ncbi:MAG TPA: hypothetical protein VGD67_20535 [Pseudonocardiaceae bacterium]
MNDYMLTSPNGNRKGIVNIRPLDVVSRRIRSNAKHVSQEAEAGKVVNEASDGIGAFSK